MKFAVVGIVIIGLFVYSLVDRQHECDEAEREFMREHDEEFTKEVEPEYESQVGEIE